MEGIITMTDKRGGIILSANIWMVLLMPGLSGGWSLNPKGLRIYIDGNEVKRPEAFDDVEEGG